CCPAASERSFGIHRSRGARQQANRRGRPLRTTPPLPPVAAGSSAARQLSCLRPHPHPCCTPRHESVVFPIKIWPPMIRWKYDHASKKTASDHLFRNVLPECNSILGTRLTAAAVPIQPRREEESAGL